MITLFPLADQHAAAGKGLAGQDMVRISDLLIDWTIEAVVKAINAKYGKDWGLTSTSEVVAKANAVAVMRRKASLRHSDAAWENGKN